MLEFFLNQATPIAFIVLVGLASMFGAFGFLVGGFLLNTYQNWDWYEAWSTARAAIAVSVSLVGSAWIAGLVVVILLDLIGVGNA